jgi:hypothetical protein
VAIDEPELVELAGCSPRPERSQMRWISGSGIDNHSPAPALGCPLAARTVLIASSRAASRLTVWRIRSIHSSSREGRALAPRDDELADVDVLLQPRMRAVLVGTLT